MKSDSASARAAILALLKVSPAGPHRAAKALHIGHTRCVREMFALEQAGLIKAVECEDGRPRYALMIDALRIEADRSEFKVRRRERELELKRRRYHARAEADRKLAQGDDVDYLPVKRSIIPASTAPRVQTTAPRSVWDLA